MITIKRGHQWFRPMEVELRVVLTSCKQARVFADQLTYMGFDEEAAVLRAKIQREETEARVHKSLGYICDPEDRYKAGHVK